jgi:GTP pyrophosphokinase
LKPSSLTAVAPHFGFQTADDLMIAVGYGRISALQVVNRLLPPEIIEERKQKSKPVTPVLRQPRHDGIKVQGLNDILVNFARCCHPLPGDSIVGYITRGRGVTVHTTECLSVEKLE